MQARKHLTTRKSLVVNLWVESAIRRFVRVVSIGKDWIKKYQTGWRLRGRIKKADLAEHRKRSWNWLS